MAKWSLFQLQLQIIVIVTFKIQNPIEIVASKIADSSRHQMVEVTIGGGSELQGSEADVMQSFERLFLSNWTATYRHDCIFHF